MPERVATKPWQQDNVLFTVCLFQYLLITVTHDTSESLIQRSLMLYVPESVDKHEIRISVHSHLTRNALLFLILLFLQKGFSHMVKHWHSSSACFRLWRIYREITTVLAMVIVHQRMIHTDSAILKI